MKHWHCTACHHEWDGNTTNCDWCNNPGEVMDDKPAKVPWNEFVKTILSARIHIEIEHKEP